MVGMLGISPKDFWNMSIREITLAMKGFREYNTGKSSAPMGKDELEELKERYPDF